MFAMDEEYAGGSQLSPISFPFTNWELRLTDWYSKSDSYFLIVYLQMIEIFLLSFKHEQRDEFHITLLWWFGW